MFVATAFGHCYCAIMETVTISGDLTVNRMGYGAMRITGRGHLGSGAQRASPIAYYYPMSVVCEPRYLGSRSVATVSVSFTQC